MITTEDLETAPLGKKIEAIATRKGISVQAMATALSCTSGNVVRLYKSDSWSLAHLKAASLLLNENLIAMIATDPELSTLQVNEESPIYYTMSVHKELSDTRHEMAHLQELLAQKNKTLELYEHLFALTKDKLKS